MILVGKKMCLRKLLSVLLVLLAGFTLFLLKSPLQEERALAHSPSLTSSVYQGRSTLLPPRLLRQERRAPAGSRLSAIRPCPVKSMPSSPKSLLRFLLPCHGSGGSSRCRFRRSSGMRVRSGLWSRPELGSTSLQQGGRSHFAPVSACGPVLTGSTVLASLRTASGYCGTMRTFSCWRASNSKRV